MPMRQEHPLDSRVGSAGVQEDAKVGRESVWRGSSVAVGVGSGPTSLL
jgi:hypothetical protein